MDEDRPLTGAISTAMGDEYPLESIPIGSVPNELPEGEEEVDSRPLEIRLLDKVDHSLIFIYIFNYFLILILCFLLVLFDPIFFFLELENSYGCIFVFGTKN